LSSEALNLIKYFIRKRFLPCVRGNFCFLFSPYHWRSYNSL